MKKVIFILVLLSLAIACIAQITTLASNNPAVTANNIGLSTAKHCIYRFTLTRDPSGTINLTGVTFTTTGTYSSTDVTKFQLWANNTDNFITSTQIGSDLTSSLGTGSHSFSSLTYSLGSSNTRYFWITTDIASNATELNTLSVSAMTTSNITVSSGTKTGTAYAGGIQTIGWSQTAEGFETYPFSAWTNNSVTQASYNYHTGSNSALFNANGDYIYSANISHPGIVSFWGMCANGGTSPSIKVQTSTNASTWTDRLTQQLTTTYTKYTVDLSALSNVYIRFYRSAGTKNGFLDDVYITYRAPGTQISGISFTSVSLTSITINWTNGNGDKRAIFLQEATAISPGNAIDGTNYTASNDWSNKGTQLESTGFYCVYNNTGTSVTVTNLSANTTYYVAAYEYNTSGSLYVYKNPAATGNTTTLTHTITLASANPAIAAGSIEPNSAKNLLYRFTIGSANATATLNQVNFTTAGTYIAADLSNLKLWYKSTDEFETASQIGSALTSSLGTGSHSFTGLTQGIADAATGYFWITADLPATATIANTISIAAITISNLTFASGVKTGTAYAGGTQTIAFTSAATDYFRTCSAGDWDDTDIWEGSHNSVTWFASTLSPTTQAYMVYLNHNVNLPTHLILRNATFNAGGQITLGNFNLNGSGIITGTPVIILNGTGVATGAFATSANPPITNLNIPNPVAIPSVVLDLNIDAGSTVYLPNDVVIEDSLSFSNGNLNLNGYTFTLQKKSFGMHSAEATLSNLSVTLDTTSVHSSAEDFSLSRTWTTSGSISDTVNILLIYPESLTSSNSVTVWNRDHGSSGDWTEVGVFEPVINGATRIITIPGITTINGSSRTILDWTIAATGDYISNAASFNWSSRTSWLRYNGTSWVAPTVAQGAPSSSSGVITIRNGHSVTLDTDKTVDQLAIDSGGKLILSNGKTMTLANGSGTDLIVRGDLELIGNVSSSTNSAIEVSGSIDFDNDSTISSAGSFTLSSGATLITANVNGITAAGTNSGSVQTTNRSFSTEANYTYKDAGEKGNTGSGLPATVNNLNINNPYDVALTNDVNVYNTLSYNEGRLDIGMKAVQMDGFYSPSIDYLEILADGEYVVNFEVDTQAMDANYPTRIKRQWSLSSDSFLHKDVIFYWTAEEDNNYIWGTQTPALYVGDEDTQYVPTEGNYDLTSDPRWMSLNFTNSFPTGIIHTGLESNETLPVELSSFTGLVTPQNYAFLQWTTQSESNVSGYYIFRGTENNLAIAERIDVFIGATNTSQETEYSFIDREATPGCTIFYWLQHIDMSGEFAFHGPVSITLNALSDNAPAIPYKTGIQQVFPNPFNPNTAIAYGLAKPASVRLAVYNGKGELVRTLYSGYKSAGNYRVYWNGRDNNGKSLTSGIYLVKLNADNVNSYQKLLMIK